KKCGGEFPSCKRCVRGGYGLDCQYVDERGKTGVQLLEASVTKLETRLAELQILAAKKQQVLEIYVPGRGGLRQNAFDLNPIMDYFAPYAFQFGFFMHGPRLCQLMFSQSNFCLLSPNLLNVIYLWGIHLSGDERLLAHEPLFLTRAVTFDLSGQQPRHVVHNIQAEILLVAYFLRLGNVNSAMHRLNSALSLCISYGLHRQASNRPNIAISLHLPPPRDSIDQGERIDAFWTTFLFYKALDMKNMISLIMDESIDTPFPLEMSAYEGGIVPSNLGGVRTLKSFVNAPGADLSHGALALTAKAAALFERARYYGENWQSGKHEKQVQSSVLIDFAVLYPDEQKFEEDLLFFIESVPPLSQFVGPYTKYTWITVVTLLQVAVIHLHGSRKYNASNRKCLDAAQMAANLIASFNHLNNVQYIHPIMAVRLHVGLQCIHPY
ncbi:hypothetical protein F5877DRAFT_38145, partial [Lentinula edodes]